MYVRRLGDRCESYVCACVCLQICMHVGRTYIRIYVRKFTYTDIWTDKEACVHIVFLCVCLIDCSPLLLSAWIRICLYGFCINMYVCLCGFVYVHVWLNISLHEGLRLDMENLPWRRAELRCGDHIQELPNLHVRGQHLLDGPHGRTWGSLLHCGRLLRCTDVAPGTRKTDRKRHKLIQMAMDDKHQVMAEMAKP